MGQSARMKKWGIIAAVAAFGIFAVLDVMHDFVDSNPIGYFSRDPSRLLYVAGIAVAGGLLTLGYYKLSLRTQRRVRMLSLGMAACAATAAFGYFVFAFFSLASIASKHGGSTWPVLSMLLPVLLVLCGMAAYCWFACWRVWRTGVSR